LKRLTDREKRLSKYEACRYLNVSRATFDNYVREGKLPRGKHEVGFKELSRYWALKIGKAHSVLSYRLKVHGIDNLRKYIEQRTELV
jgi:predicted site-specific integrase-resolvase